MKNISKHYFCFFSSHNPEWELQKSEKQILLFKKMNLKGKKTNF